MKTMHIFVVKLFFILIGPLGLVCPHTCHGVPSPEIILVEQLWEVGSHDTQRESLLQSVIFFNDSEAVKRLLDHLQLLDKSDVRHQHKRLMYRVIMERMTCHPEQIIMERLRTETDSWEKAKLMNLLRDFYSGEIFLALINQLDDTREVKCASCGRSRVCDLAYHDLVFKLEVLDIVERRHFEPIFGKAHAYQDTLIKMFLQYWEENKTLILQKLPEREVPKHLKRLFD